MERQLHMNMQTQSIVPDVIAEYPPNIVSITYEDGIKVDMGNFLTPTQVKNIPIVQYEAEENSFYTLCMTDPDAPSRENPKFREWHHWLVGNIPGNDVGKGETLSEYIGSGPPKGTGYHRYVFLVYKQRKKIDFHEQRLKKNSGKNRGKFSISNFAQKYKLGNPIAGNFFQAEYDDYVPLLYKQLNCC